MALNEDGSDLIFAVMIQCDVTYEKGFAQTGYTKSAKLALSFQQVVQGIQKDGRSPINFKSIGRDGNYMRLDRTGLGRKMNTNFQPGGSTFETLSAVESPGKINPSDINP